MSAGLTTHVLDTSQESPGVGVEVKLQKISESGDAETINQGTTNDDGRLDEPLLTADEIEEGTYQLIFEVGQYYDSGSSGTSFLNTVPVRFIIDDPEEHYHVPLLLSPGGYTTYRGS
jgi:5-hydroxyisourate hydrolase